MKNPVRNVTLKNKNWFVLAKVHFKQNWKRMTQFTWLQLTALHIVRNLIRNWNWIFFLQKKNSNDVNVAVYFCLSLFTDVVEAVFLLTKIIRRFPSGSGTEWLLFADKTRAVEAGEPTKVFRSLCFGDLRQEERCLNVEENKN